MRSCKSHHMECMQSISVGYLGSRAKTLNHASRPPSLDSTRRTIISNRLDGDDPSGIMSALAGEPKRSRYIYHGRRHLLRRGKLAGLTATTSNSWRISRPAGWASSHMLASRYPLRKHLNDYAMHARRPLAALWKKNLDRRQAAALCRITRGYHCPGFCCGKKKSPSGAPTGIISTFIQTYEPSLLGANRKRARAHGSFGHEFASNLLLNVGYLAIRKNIARYTRT